MASASDNDAELNQPSNKETTTTVDARVQSELEKLNCSSDVINKLEKDLELKRRRLRQLEMDRDAELNRLRRKLGTQCIERASIYHRAVAREERRRKELDLAKDNFDKACSRLSAAQEMVSLAEEGFRSQSCVFDEAWQEMINHAVEKVTDAESEKRDRWQSYSRVKIEHERSAARLSEIATALAQSIRRSTGFFESDNRFAVLIDDQRREVELTANAVADTKKGYSQSLRALESISDEVHRQRREIDKELQTEVKEKEMISISISVSSSSSSSSSCSLSQLAPPTYELLKAADVDSSDSESLISLEMLEPMQLEQLRLDDTEPSASSEAA